MNEVFQQRYKGRPVLCSACFVSSTFSNSMKTSNSTISTIAPRLVGGASSLCTAAIMFLAGESLLAAPSAGINQSAMNQIGALFMEKASWTPIQARMDSELVHAIKNHRGQP